jgi:hypothetical protein
MNIEFDEIHDYIKNELETDNAEEILNEFGDNLEHYIQKLYTEDFLEDDNEGIADHIYSEWIKYINNKYNEEFN